MFRESQAEPAGTRCNFQKIMPMKAAGNSKCSKDRRNEPETRAVGLVALWVELSRRGDGTIDEAERKGIRKHASVPFPHFSEAAALERSR